LPITSMTGFARVEGSWQDIRWTWELKSVNSKGLDVRYRLPSGLEAHDRAVKSIVAGGLARGNVNCQLSMESGDAGVQLVVNERALDSAVVAAKRSAEKYGLELPKIADLMALRGVVDVQDSELSEEDRQDRDSAILETLKQAVEALAKDRGREGEQLYTALRQRVDEIDLLTRRAEQDVSGQVGAIRAKLSAQIAEALGDTGITIEQERLAQETAVLALKADVSEETDRLHAHVLAARDLLDADEPVGRKFDFLAQEFGREANTLASKAASNELSAIALELKVAIDQMREQIQNVE
jgi:uncharacterized protein (TIGR00255 family)